MRTIPITALLLAVGHLAPVESATLPRRSFGAPENATFDYVVREYSERKIAKGGPQYAICTRDSE